MTHRISMKATAIYLPFVYLLNEHVVREKSVRLQLSEAVRMRLAFWISIFVLGGAALLAVNPQHGEAAVTGVTPSAVAARLPSQGYALWHLCALLAAGTNMMRVPVVEFLTWRPWLDGRYH